jgi:hypothetical protein
MSASPDPVIFVTAYWRADFRSPMLSGDKSMGRHRSNGPPPAPGG